MTWIKICGITNIEDARTAIDAGADALGFVFYAKSPRNVDAASVRAITTDLPDPIEKIGVFVNQPPAEMEITAQSAALTGLQIHFTKASAGGKLQEFSQSSYKNYLALPFQLITGELDPASYLAPAIDAIFLDSGTRDQPGGTGKTFDWKAAAPLVQDLSRRFKIVVAGGLTPENVVDAIHILKPWGVDVSSGVEAKPGKKDPGKLRAFIRAVRHMEVSV